MKRTHWIITVAVAAFASSLSVVAQPPPPPGGGQRQVNMTQGPVPMPMRVQQGNPGIPMGPDGGPGPLGGIVGLLQNPELARELSREIGLLPEQVTELREIMRESRDLLRPPAIPFNPGPPTNQRGPGQGSQTQTFPPRTDSGEMRRRMEEGRQRIEAGIDAVQEKLDRVLKPEQQEKLRNIAFQLSGGLESPMLGLPQGDRALAALDLTETQKEQFRKLVEERRINFEGYNLRSAEDLRRLRANTEANNTRFVEQVKGFLTPEQKAKAEQLTDETPELRKRLGMSALGPGQPRGQPPPGWQSGGWQSGGPPPGGNYTPGQDAWRPGQTPPPPGSRPQQRQGFPRGEN